MKRIKLLGMPVTIYVERQGAKQVIRSLNVKGVEFEDEEVYTVMTILKFFVSGRLFHKGGERNIQYVLNFIKDFEGNLQNVELVIYKNDPLTGEAKKVILNRLEADKIYSVLDMQVRYRKASIYFYIEEED